MITTPGEVPAVLVREATPAVLPAFAEPQGACPASAHALLQRATELTTDDAGGR